MITLKMVPNQCRNRMRDEVAQVSHFAFYDPKQWFGYEHKRHTLQVRSLWKKK